MTTEVAVASNAELERMTPEREAFEAWCCKRWGGDRDALRRRDMAGSERFGEYVNGHVQFAWDAWQAAQTTERKRWETVGWGVVGSFGRARGKWVATLTDMLRSNVRGNARLTAAQEVEDEPK